MTKVEILNMQKKVASKMLSATAMLLISAILMVGVSYAWITISRAPEAKDIKTAVVGNGALEIALQSSVSGQPNKRMAVTDGRGKSTAISGALNANKAWGNVIDLSEGYGIDLITLYPSRMNAYNNSNTVNTNGYLSIPVYGTDGRIIELENAKFVTYGSSAFTEGRSYGVNILGSPSESEDSSDTITYHYRRSVIRDEAAGYVLQYRESLRTDMISMLQEQQVGIFNILVTGYMMLSQSTPQDLKHWTQDNVNTASAIIERMRTILADSTTSMKWALLASCVADNDKYPSNNTVAMETLGTLYKEILMYPLTSNSGVSIRGVAEENGYNDLVTAIDWLISAQEHLNQAKIQIAEESTYTNAILQIIDVLNTFLKNGTQKDSNGNPVSDPGVGTPHTIYENGYGLTYNVANNVTTDYCYFAAPKNGADPGLFSIMAGLLGDYESTETAYQGLKTVYIGNTPIPLTEFYDNDGDGARKQYTMYMRATAEPEVAEFNQNNNKGVLQEVYNAAMSYNPGNAMISFSVNSRANVAAYGYSIDFAFRSNEDGKLLLRHEGSNRITGELNENASPEGNEKLQGGGSNMKLTLSGDLIGAGHAIARDIIKNIMIVLTDTDSGQILGIIAADDIELVLEQGDATLAVYEPDYAPDGTIKLGAKRADDYIAELRKNTVKYITAIVFLNGDTLAGGSMGATQRHSLTGTVNLQFASSAQLVPLTNYEPE